MRGCAASLMSEGGVQANEISVVEERERIADERERIADERERLNDERERRLIAARSSSGEALWRSQEALRRRTKRSSGCEA